jgi:hypothetical protein
MNKAPRFAEPQKHRPNLSRHWIAQAYNHVASGMIPLFASYGILLGIRSSAVSDRDAGGKESESSN